MLSNFFHSAVLLAMLGFANAEITAFQIEGPVDPPQGISPTANSLNFSQATIAEWVQDPVKMKTLMDHKRIQEKELSAYFDSIGKPYQFPLKLNSFSETPVPLAVPDQRETDRLRRMANISEGRNSRDYARDENRPGEVYRFFPRAATFNVMGYDKWGNASIDRQAIIFEGMRVVLEHDGEYEIDFLIETPAMPMTLRLQFQVVNPNVNESDRDQQFVSAIGHGPASPITITMPVVVIEPRSISPDRPGVYQVHHRGYSPVLHKWSMSSGKLNSVVISRIGTATLGFPSTKYIDDYYAEQIVTPRLADPVSGN